MTIKALVFDFDGTILDTETADYQSWNEIYQTYGTELSLTTWVQYVGGSGDGFDPYTLLEEQIGHPIEREKVRTQRRARYAELVATRDVMPGVMSYISSAKEQKMRLAVASSSDADWVYSHLRTLDLLDCFDTIRTANDVINVKPDPALYRQAVDALGVAPSQAIAFEDSRNGMLAAKRAGLHCVVIPHAITQNLTFNEADLRLDSLEELPFAKLIDRFSRPM